MYNCDVVVAGAGPAGLTASMYLARAGFYVINITGKNPGGNLVKIATLDNFPGYKSISGYDLWEIMMDQCRDVGVEFVEWCNVDQYEKDGDLNPIVVHYTDFNNKSKYLKCRAFINCCGGVNKTLNLPNEDKFWGKGLSVCATCDGPYYKGKDVVVIGGGNTAFDYAITLSKYCSSVTIIHRRDVFKASRDMIDKACKIDNINYLTDFNVVELIGDDKLTNVVVKSNKTELCTSINCDCVFYAIGFDPAFIPCRVGGMETGTWSAGDVKNKYDRQVITACGSGCTAALQCIRFLQGERYLDVLSN